MATDITVNTTKNVLSIAVDKTHYPSANYPPFIDIPIPFGMEKGTGTAPLIIKSGTDRFSFDTAIGTINVSAVAATSNADLRTKILAAI